MKEPIVTLTLIQSVLSSVSLVLFNCILKKITKNRKIIVLFTFLFLINFSQIVFTVSIETYIIAQFFLIIMWYFIISKLGKKMTWIDYTLLITLGIGALSITLTNYAQYIIGAFFLIYSKDKRLESITKYVLCLLTTLSVSILLSEVQSIIWPTAPLFFHQNILNLLSGSSEETLYISKIITISNFKNVLNSNFSYLLYFFNIAKPGNGIYITFVNSKITDIISILLFVLFVCLNITYISKKRKAILSDNLYLALLFTYLFNFGLHLIYGNTICFLYTCHYQFVMLLITAYILSELDCIKNNGYLLIIILISILCGRTIVKLIMIFTKTYAPIEYFRIAPLAIVVIALLLLITICLIKKKKIMLFLFLIVTSLGCIAHITINKKANENELSDYNKYSLLLKKYENQLKNFKNEYYIKTFSNYRKKMKVFFLGMATENKFLYKDGKIIRIKDNEIVYSFKYDKEVIVPNKFTIYLENKKEKALIYEDENGIFIKNGKSIKALYEREKPINLPDFTGNKYSEVLRVLLQEILFNIDGAEPKPNIFGYKQAYYRDAMLATMVMEYTNNIEIIKPWAMSLNKVYDNSRSIDINEADNLGELMYILGACNIKKGKLVDKIIKEIDDIRTEDNAISGMVDGMIQKYYPTVVAIYGANKMGINLNLTKPVVDDGYAKLTWYTDKIASNNYQESKYYPYINWAFYHYAPYGSLYMLDELYPLSYEGGEAVGDYKIEKECMISEYYCENQVFISHLWHASEMFLYIIDNQ